MGLFPPDVPALADEVAGGFGIALGECLGKEAGGADKEGVAFYEAGVFEVGDGETLGEFTEGGTVFFIAEGGEEFLQRSCSGRVVCSWMARRRVLRWRRSRGTFDQGVMVWGVSWAQG